MKYTTNRETHLSVSSWSVVTLVFLLKSISYTTLPSLPSDFLLSVFSLSLRFTSYCKYPCSGKLDMTCCCLALNFLLSLLLLLLMIMLLISAVLYISFPSPDDQLSWLKAFERAGAITGQTEEVQCTSCLLLCWPAREWTQLTHTSKKCHTLDKRVSLHSLLPVGRRGKNQICNVYLWIWSKGHIWKHGFYGKVQVSINTASHLSLSCDY